ncbi:MAG: AAA family ATPase [Byssovorax sp.]
MKRRFNVSGPCIASMHYMIPAERRLPEAPSLVDQLGYIVVHAPRQTGKTTALIALARDLTASGRYAAVLSSCEEGQASGDDFGSAQRAILGELSRRAASELPPELRPPPLSLSGDEGLVATYLEDWARSCPRPLVLLLDEIDALQGNSLLSVLRQLRAGFPYRPAEFPASVILCGLRDVRDYKAVSGDEPSRLGTSSPFNIKLDSLRLGDFTLEEVRELYAQHTADTGQVFIEEAVIAAFAATAGQPWLVNALAREIVEGIATPPSETITAAHVEQAKERLILARATHLNSLVSKLHEPRVRNVIEPILAGETRIGEVYDDDAAYVRDLGLVAPGKPLRIANPIYREVIVRVLVSSAEDFVTAEPRSFVLPDGRLDLRRILNERVLRA